MLRIQRVSILLFVGLLYATIVRSQGFAIRNNLLYDATLTPNFGVEMRLDSVWTMGLNAGFNLWDYDKAKNKKWRHILISPNFRHYNDTLFRKSFWLTAERSKRNSPAGVTGTVLTAPLFKQSARTPSFFPAIPPT